MLSTTIARGKKFRPVFSNNSIFPICLCHSKAKLSAPASSNSRSFVLFQGTIYIIDYRNITLYVSIRYHQSKIEIDLFLCDKLLFSVYVGTPGISVNLVLEFDNLISRSSLVSRRVSFKVEIYL